LGNLFVVGTTSTGLDGVSLTGFSDLFLLKFGGN